MTRRLIALALILTATAAAPAAAADDVHARNVRYLAALAGLEAPPEGVAEVLHNGVRSTTSIPEAFARAAARARDVDLAAVSAAFATPPPPGGPPPPAVGDVWIAEIGTGTCGSPDLYNTTPIPASSYPQLNTYSGALAYQSTTTSTQGTIIDWTSKGGGTYTTGGATAIGNGDWFCIHFFDLYLWFPMTDGAAYKN